MVQDCPDVPSAPKRLDSVDVRVDEPRLISDAGLLLTATLADRLGLEGLVNESVWLPYGIAGAALPGRKVMTLVHGMIAGADCIDDMDLLRAGATQMVLGHRVMAPSTLGTPTGPVPPDPRDPLRYRRGAAHPVAERLGEHSAWG